MSGEKKKYYHYTNEGNAKMIEASGVIKQSKRTEKGDDASFGSGVYMTTKPPTETKRNIAKNNYDGGAEKQMRQGKLDKAVEVECSDESVSVQDSERDIVVYRGDLNLKGRSHKFLNVKE